MKCMRATKLIKTNVLNMTEKCYRFYSYEGKIEVCFEGKYCFWSGHNFHSELFRGQSQSILLNTV